MLLLNDRQREPAARIDCSRCSDSMACDLIRRECPKVNVYTSQADDISILNREPEKHHDKNVIRYRFQNMPRPQTRAGNRINRLLVI